MMPTMDSNSSGTLRLLRQAEEGDQQAWSEMLAKHYDRLLRMVALRLDQRLQGRIDAEDVVQEAWLEASTHLAEYLQRPTMPFFLWLRGITGNVLLTVHRRHLGTQKRNAGQEVALYRGSLPGASSAALAAQLLGKDTRPSEAAIRAERKILLQQALNLMDPIDREVLALRHFEQLTTPEVAQVLEITKKAAAKRYIRALKRLKEILLNLPRGMG
jgi:RNA polymerase sigma-70 factor, ECF subfamily